MSAGRWRIYLLVGSLALNLLLAGILAGSWFAEVAAGTPHAGGLRGDFNFRHMAQALPPESRAVFRQEFEARRAHIRGRYVELAEARRAAAAAMLADPFDRQRLADAFADVRRRTAAAQEATQTAITDLSGRLGPDDRRRLVEAVQQGPQERRRAPPGPPPGEGPRR